MATSMPICSQESSKASQPWSARVSSACRGEVGQIIVASVNTNHVRKLVDADQVELRKLITKSA